MSDQPEALRLIDTFVSRRDLAWHCSATAELRRLNEENERLREALKKALPFVLSSHDPVGSELQEIEAALRREET